MRVIKYFPSVSLVNFKLTVSRADAACSQHSTSTPKIGHMLDIVHREQDAFEGLWLWHEVPKRPQIRYFIYIVSGRKTSASEANLGQG